MDVGPTDLRENERNATNPRIKILLAKAPPTEVLRHLRVTVPHMYFEADRWATFTRNPSEAAKSLCAGLDMESRTDGWRSGNWF